MKPIKQIARELWDEASNIKQYDKDAYSRISDLAGDVYELHESLAAALGLTAGQERGEEMTLKEARENIGRGVVYNPTGVRPDTGVITSVNDRFVFVRYGANKGSLATYPHDLIFELSGKEETSEHH